MLPITAALAGDECAVCVGYSKVILQSITPFNDAPFHPLRIDCFGRTIIDTAHTPQAVFPEADQLLFLVDIFHGAITDAVPAVVTFLCRS